MRRGCEGSITSPFSSPVIPVSGFDIGHGVSRSASTVRRSQPSRCEDPGCFACARYLSTAHGTTHTISMPHIAQHMQCQHKRIAHALSVRCMHALTTWHTASSALRPQHRTRSPELWCAWTDRRRCTTQQAWMRWSSSLNMRSFLRRILRAGHSGLGFGVWVSGFRG